MSATTPHARWRAGERLGLTLGQTEARQIIAAIRSGRSTCIRATSRSRSVHVVTLDGVDWTVVYSKALKKIITVLPPKENQT